MNGFANRRVVGPLATLDKSARVAYGEGCSSMYVFIVTDFLYNLCEKNGIDFKSDEFCKEMVNELEKAVKEKWDSTFVF